LARQKNLSQERIKIRILSYLYNREEGSNAHSIQFHAISGGLLDLNKELVMSVVWFNQEKYLVTKQNLFVTMMSSQVFSSWAWKTHMPM